MLFSNVQFGKVLLWKMFCKWQRWLENKWNAVQCKDKNVRVINGKERFRFYIFYCLKNWQSFEMEVCLLKGRGGDNISRQILLRSSKVIC